MHANNVIINELTNFIFKLHRSMLVNEPARYFRLRTNSHKGYGAAVMGYALHDLIIKLINIQTWAA